LPVLLYGCETWSLTLRDELRLRVFFTKYSSGDKIENNEMGGACSAYGGEERGIKGFGGET